MGRIRACCSGLRACLLYTLRTVIFRRICYFVLIYFLTFCVFLPALTFRLQFSAFYQPRNINTRTSLERKANEVRVEKAKWRIKHDRAAEFTKSVSNSSNLQEVGVLLTVISMRRDAIAGDNPRYLSQVVTETVDLYRRFQTAKGSDPNFFRLALCNIDPLPKSYAELNEIAEVYRIHTFTRFLNSKPSESENRNRHLKERNDYIYCLRKSLELNPHYVMLLEDDALPINDAFWVIYNTVTNTLKRYFKKHLDEKLGFVKFYHPYRFFNRVVFWEVLGFSFFFGTILTTFHYFLSKDKSYVHLNWFFYILLVFLIGVTLGYANLVKMRHLSTHLYTMIPSRDCCTPAVLFSNSSAHDFADYFDNHPCRSECPKDLLLRPFLRDTNSQGLMVLPNIYDHIGLYSVVQNRVKHPDVLNKR